MTEYTKNKANRAATWTAAIVAVIFFFKFLFRGASTELFATFVLCLAVFTGLAWVIALASAGLERK
jgi:hypothetical protein